MTKLVCFDLDDTLVHSFMLPYMLNCKLKQLLEIEGLENNENLHWIEADYRKAALMNGLSVEKLRDCFLDTLKPLSNVKQTSH